MNNVMDHCSRCGKALEDMRIFTSLSLNVERKKTNDIWEEIPNLDQVSKEILCKDCFDEFAELLAQMNTAKDPATQGALNETQLDPLHKQRRGIGQTNLPQTELDRAYEERTAQQTEENTAGATQEELDRRYEERLAQEGRGSTQPTRLDGASPAPLNPAEELRQEVAREKELARPEFYGDTSQIDDNLGSVPPEKQAELDRQFASSGSEPLQNSSIPQTENKDEYFDPILGRLTPEQKTELDRAYAERMAGDPANTGNNPSVANTRDPGRAERVRNAKSPGDLVRTVHDVTYGNHEAHQPQ